MNSETVRARFALVLPAEQAILTPVRHTNGRASGHRSTALTSDPRHDDAVAQGHRQRYPDDR
jgi:hypothetical protein